MKNMAEQAQIPPKPGLFKRFHARFSLHGAPVMASGPALHRADLSAGPEAHGPGPAPCLGAKVDVSVKKTLKTMGFH